MTSGKFFIFISVILIAFLYVGQRLATSFGYIATIIALAILFAGFLSFRAIHDMKNPFWRNLLTAALHAEMAVLSFVFAFVVLRDLIFLPLAYIDAVVSAQAFGLEGGLILLAFVAVSFLAGFMINALGPRVMKIDIPIENLPTEFQNFTIAQISDLHVSPSTKPKFVASVVEKTLKLQPSMVALTGDIGDGHLENSLSAMKELAPLSTGAPHGAFYVTGNHEFYSNGLEWVKAFKEIGFKTLMNSNEVITKGAQRMLIAGVLDPAAGMALPQAKPDAKAAARGAGNTNPKILLAHQPGIADEAANTGFDLQLSGHTHAGQFFPWTLVIGRFHEFAQGLGRKGKMWVYVNPGTGSWGPQIRLGSRTEITLLTLKKAE
jgi:predicted MPP superfamily phosphohydrolase